MPNREEKPIVDRKCSSDSPEAAPQRRLRTRDLIGVVFRSFFLQSAFNFRSLISIGFGICLFPLARRLYPDRESRKDFLERHFKFFNAHPYMASFALGVSIRLEEDYAHGDEEAHQKLDRVKELLISILGAVGDQLFWMGIRPFSLLTGVAVLLLLPGVPAKLIGLTGVFILYNAPHLYLRFRGVQEGYSYGLEIYKCFRPDRFRNLQRSYFILAVLSTLTIIGALGYRLGEENLLSLGVGLGSGILSYLVFVRSKNFYFTIALTLLFSVIIGLVYL